MTETTEHKMTDAEARAFMKSVAAEVRRSGDQNGAARIELWCEYFTNPTFRKFLGDYMWDLTQSTMRGH